MSERRRRPNDPDRLLERRSLVVPAEEDESGRVITPSIDFGTGLMPNGLPIFSFYERENRPRDEAEWLAIRAVGRAAKRLLKSN